MKKLCTLLLALCALWIIPANAGERVDLFFTNNLDQEIVEIRVQYTSAYEGEEPRSNSSLVNLPAGFEGWRTGVQGVTLPEKIIIDLAAASYVFDDLSILEPSNEMYLTVMYEDGRPLLHRTDGDLNGVIQGEERKYLTDENRVYAVDRDSLTAATTWSELGELVAGTIAGAQEEPGEDAAAAAIAETVFTEQGEWGEIARFPVLWMGRYGVAKVQESEMVEEDSGDTLGFRLTFRIADASRDSEAEDNLYGMLDDFLSDLRVDGYRPWRFRMRTRDNEKEEAEEIEIAFAEDENEGDKYDHQDAIFKKMAPAYENGILVNETSILWVKEEAFDEAKEGADLREMAPTPAVLTLFSRETFEAAFMPDGRMMMQ